MRRWRRGWAGRRLRRNIESWRRGWRRGGRRWRRMATIPSWRLTRPGPGARNTTWLWDQILEFNLFPAEVREKEMAFYLRHLNTFGLPLDNRKEYTKLDWEVWTATLAEKREDFDALMKPIGRWVNEGPSRAPLTDWYDTVSGKQEGFQARSVVGGVYIKALADKELAAKWRSRVER